MSIFLYLLIIFWVILFFETINVAIDIRYRIRMLEWGHLKALELGKPFLNISCGETEYGDINADIQPQKVPNFVLFEPNKPLPFADKQFAVVYSTHTLEHVDNVEAFVQELKRVADYAIIIYPLISFIAFNPNHRWIFLDRSTKKYFRNPIYHPFQEWFPPNPFIIKSWKNRIKPKIEQLKREKAAALSPSEVANPQKSPSNGEKV